MSRLASAFVIIIVLAKLHFVMRINSRCSLMLHDTKDRYFKLQPLHVQSKRMWLKNMQELDAIKEKYRIISANPLVVEEIV